MAGREKNCKWYFADQPNVQEVGPNNAMEQSFKIILMLRLLEKVFRTLWMPFLISQHLYR